MDRPARRNSSVCLGSPVRTAFLVYVPVSRIALALFLAACATALVAPAAAPAQALHAWTAEPAWISNTGVYRQHELVYQDYLYDDHGANTDGFDHQDLPFGAAGFDPRDPTDPRLSPAPIVNYAGDFMYGAPDGNHMDDVADLWEMRVAADAGNVYLRFRLADMTAPDSTVVGVCVDEDRTPPPAFSSGPTARG